MRTRRLTPLMLIGAAILNGLATALCLQHPTLITTILLNIAWAAWGVSVGIRIDFHLQRRAEHH